MKQSHHEERSGWWDRFTRPTLRSGFILGLLQVVLVGRTDDDRALCKILLRRRRGRLPLQARRLPGVLARRLPGPERRQKIEQRQHVAHAEDRGPRGGHHVPDLELRGIHVVAAGHAVVARHELRQEREEEPHEDDHRRQPRPPIGIHPARDLRPPVVQPGHVAHDHSAHHDEMEVGHDEVGVVDVHVQAQGGQEQAGHAAEGEQRHEPQGEEHGGLEGDRALVQRGRPVEDLDRRGHGDQEAQAGEDQRRIHGNARHEHVMRPDEEAQAGDAEARIGHELVAVKLLAGEAGDDLAHHAHARQDHDVHRRVGIEPEEVLEEQGIAAQGRIEDADLPEPLDDDQDQRHGQHRHGQKEDETGGVHRPDEDRQAEPGQPRGPQPMDRDDEVQPGQQRREPGDHHADQGEGDVVVRRRRAVGRIEGPARVHSPGQHGDQRPGGARHRP